MRLLLVVAMIGACVAPAIGQFPAGDYYWPPVAGTRCILRHQVLGASIGVERVGSARTITIDGLTNTWSGSGASDFGVHWHADGAPRGTLRLFVTRGRSSAGGAAYVLRLAGAGASQQLVLPPRKWVGATLDWATVDARFAGAPAIDLVLSLRPAGGKPERVLGRQRLALDALRAAEQVRPGLEQTLDRLARDPATNCSPGDGKAGQRVHAFDCTRRWSTDLGAFSVERDALSWRRDLAGVEISLSYGWFRDEARPDRVDWAALPESQQPRLSVDLRADALGRTWGGGNYRQPKSGVVHETEFGMVAVGASEVRHLLPVNSTFSLSWTAWQRLAVSAGELRIGAIDTETQAREQRVLPHDTIDRAMATMVEGYRAMIADQRSPDTRCTPTVELENDPDQRPPVVVT